MKTREFKFIGYDSTSTPEFEKPYVFMRATWSFHLPAMKEAESVKTLKK